VLADKRAILDAVKPEATKYEEQISYAPDRSGQDVGCAIDASKIQKEPNWSPIETFESSIRETVQWYLDNQQRCLHVQDGSYKGVILA
jgi:dTDP-glucose 4,6-dehydratase